MMNYEMTPSEMLCAFLDGELDTQEAGSLFYNLANNPELQSEMRQHILMRGAVQSARHYAPETSKEKILVRTGLISAGVAAAGAGTSWFSDILKSNWFAIATTAIITSLATAGAFLSGIFTGESNQNSLANAKQKFTQGAPVVASTAPVIEYREKKIFVEKKVPVYITKIEYLPSPVTDAAKITEEADKIQNDMLISPVIIEAEKSNELNTIARNDYQHKKKNSIVITQERQAPDRFFIELRGFTANSYPASDVSDPSGNPLNNKSLNVSYEFIENSFFGFEIGKENFIQRFSGIEKGRSVAYEQNYPSYWGGFSYQYNFDPMNHISPYGRLIAGFNATGLLGKVILGAQYNYDNNMYFGLGVEGTLLQYQFSGSDFYTRKLGGTLGLGLRF